MGDRVMSKAEAVFELLEMSRGGGLSRRRVEALQIATRSLVKRVFDSSKNYALRKSRREGVESCK